MSKPAAGGAAPKEGGAAAKEKVEPLKEILPKSGLVYSEKSSLIEVMCKPRIMPLKSQSLLRLEAMEKEIKEKTKPQAIRDTAPPGSSYGSGSAVGAGANAGGFAGPGASSGGSAPLDRPVSASGGRGRLGG